MSLSILIPVYNYNVTSLVNGLVKQLLQTGKQGEIILLDDDSNSSFIAANQALQNIAAVSYHRNEKNEGRTASRQKLSALSKCDYLLFLDCDSGILKDDFLAQYFNQIENNAAVVSGGRMYSETVPACEYRLHWKYGREREGNKTAAFMSNNFLIKKELFDRLGNNVQLPGYGHEDTLWGIQLEQLGATCNYINNPVVHEQLETATAFIQKSENALKNLLLLQTQTDKNLISRHVKIFRWYLKLKSIGLAGVYSFFEKPFHNFFYKNLLSCNPSLFYFDCYRLAELIRMSKTNHS